MTTVKKFDRRAIRAANPVSFNELLDLFEAHAASILPSLQWAIYFVEEKLEYEHRGKIFTHIGEVMGNADDLVQKLGKIRAARNAGTDVTVTLPLSDARLTGHAIQEVTRLLADTESTLGLLQRCLEHDETGEHFEPLAIISLARRALSGAEEHEARALDKFASTLREAGKYQQDNQEDAA